MPIDRPERADQQPERPEQPERFNPEQRAQLDRLAEVSKRWDAIGRYEGDRANLPNPDKAEAVQYIKDRRYDRPWLLPASYEPADTQRVIASMDQGNGHQLERHEGHATDERLQRRVTALEDPGQLDRDKRAAGLDGVTGKDHHCGPEATSIQDPEMFATAFTRGIEHPKVREVLDRDDGSGWVRPVDLPIDELLGSDGHRHCSGYRLVPIDGSVDAAKAYRSAWLEAVEEGTSAGMNPPQAEPIDSFEGGHIRFVFTPTPDRTGWEVLTMYPNPKELESNPS